MPINAHPEYLAAEKEYLSLENPEDKLRALQKMISRAPKHKGAENLRAQLKTRYKKLGEKIKKDKKTGKGKKSGIKKEGVRTVIVGFTNSGKSTLLNSLTNVKPKIASHEFTTKIPLVGMLKYNEIETQVIEIPAFESEYYDKSLVHTADIILVIITDIGKIKQIMEELNKEKGKKIIIFNDNKQLSNEEKRKISENLRSKRFDFVITNLENDKRLDLLKEKIFQNSGKIRIFTKDSGKKGDLRNQKPIVLDNGSTVKDATEKILHGFSSKVKESRVTGPSSKFPNQIVGMKHELKDLDIIEFKVK